MGTFEDFAREHFGTTEVRVDASILPTLVAESPALHVEPEAQSRLEGVKGGRRVSVADRLSVLPDVTRPESRFDQVSPDHKDMRMLLRDILVPVSYGGRTGGVNGVIDTIGKRLIDCPDDEEEEGKATLPHVGSHDEDSMRLAFANAMANLLDLAAQYPIVLPHDETNASWQTQPDGAQKQLEYTRGAKFIELMLNPLGTEAFRSGYARLRLAIQATRLVITQTWYESAVINAHIATDPIMYYVAAWFLTTDETWAALIADRLGAFECGISDLTPSLSPPVLARRIWRLIFKFNLQDMSDRIWPFKQAADPADLEVGDPRIQRGTGMHLTPMDATISTYVTAHSMQFIEPYVMDHLRAHQEWVENTGMKFAVPSGTPITISLRSSVGARHASWFTVKATNAVHKTFETIADPQVFGDPTITTVFISPLGPATPLPSSRDTFSTTVTVTDTPLLVFALVVSEALHPDGSALIHVSDDVLLAPVSSCVRCRETTKRLWGIETSLTPTECSWILERFDTGDPRVHQVVLDEGFFYLRYHLEVMRPYIKDWNLRLSALGMSLVVRKFWNPMFPVIDAQRVCPEDTDELQRAFTLIKDLDSENLPVHDAEALVALSRAAEALFTEAYRAKYNDENVTPAMLVSFDGILRERELAREKQHILENNEPTPVRFSGTHSANRNLPDYLSEIPGFGSLVTSVPGSETRMNELQRRFIVNGDRGAALQFNALLKHYYPLVATADFELKNEALSEAQRTLGAFGV